MEDEKAVKQEESAVQKKRGKLLGFLLITNVLFLLWGLLSFIFAESPVLGRTYQLVGFFLGLFIWLGIFFWKRWAVYLLFGTGVFSLIVYEILVQMGVISIGFTRTPMLMLLSYAPAITLLILWFIAIKRKWYLFQ